MLAQKVPLPKPPHPILFLIPLGDAAKEICIEILYQLRHEDIPCDIDYSARKVGKSLERAASLGATYAAVIGDEELSSKSIKLKNLATREETALPTDQISPWLRKQL